MELCIEHNKLYIESVPYLCRKMGDFLETNFFFFFFLFLIRDLVLPSSWGQAHRFPRELQKAWSNQQGNFSLTGPDNGNFGKQNITLSTEIWFIKPLPYFKHRWITDWKATMSHSHSGANARHSMGTNCSKSSRDISFGEKKGNWRGLSKTHLCWSEPLELCTHKGWVYTQREKSRATEQKCPRKANLFSNNGDA